MTLLMCVVEVVLCHCSGCPLLPSFLLADTICNYPGPFSSSPSEAARMNDNFGRVLTIPQEEEDLTTWLFDS